MLTQIEKELLNVNLNEGKTHFSKLEIELMEKLLMLNEELKCQLVQRNNIEEQLSELIYEKHEADLKVSVVIDEKSEVEDELNKIKIGIPKIFEMSMKEFEKANRKIFERKSV